MFKACDWYLGKSYEASYLICSSSVIETVVLTFLFREILRDGVLSIMEHLHAGNMEVFHVTRSSWKKVCHIKYDCT
jgi:hypothetical protein